MSDMIFTYLRNTASKPSSNLVDLGWKRRAPVPEGAGNSRGGRH